MNKITACILSVLSCSSLAYAGSMGAQSSGCCSSFASLELGYTTNTINNYEFTITGLEGAPLSSIKNSQHYAARLAAGMINMIDELWGMSGELGWGYYGRTTLNPEFVGFGGLSFTNTISGFDALLGISFIQPNYLLFLKAGALIQNVRNQVTANTDELSFPFFDSITLSSNQTAALPEIKIGAGYQFDSNWALTGAYALAIGSTQRTRGTFNPITFAGTLNSNTQNPTLNMLLLGVQYTC